VPLRTQLRFGAIQRGSVEIRERLLREKHGSQSAHAADDRGVGLIDRAADLIVESATLVHDNERRWRVFGGRVSELTSAADGD
jgi:hypothetical protein